MGVQVRQNCISLLCALPGRYALGTWWLSNMRCLGCLAGRNSQVGHVTTSFMVVPSHFSPSNRGALGQNQAGFQAPSCGKWSR